MYILTIGCKYEGQYFKDVFSTKQAAYRYILNYMYNESTEYREAALLYGKSFKDLYKHNAEHFAYSVIQKDYYDHT